MRERLPASEWQVMLALWRLDRPANTMEVQLELGEIPPRDNRTIQVLLNRCAEKGWVKVTKARRPKKPRRGEKGRPPSVYYRATVARRDAFRAEIASFLEERLELPRQYEDWEEPDREPLGMELLEEALAGYRAASKAGRFLLEKIEGPGD